MKNILTVLEAIKLSEDYLKKKNVEEARVNAELLLADILNCKRLELYLKFDRPLNSDEKALYREYLKRRGEREPLQYIVGRTEFYGLEFKTDRRALIPRQETELLVEKVIDQLKKDIGQLSILDIGTGTGNIPVAIAKNISEAKVTSIDISSEALELAEENARAHKVNDNIEFRLMNIFDEEIKTLQKFDAVVSNPPYIAAEKYSRLEPELLNYEPKIALTDSGDGYVFFRRISAVASELLKPNGVLFFEISDEQSEIITDVMTQAGFIDITVYKDYQNMDRIIKGTIG